MGEECFEKNRCLIQQFSLKEKKGVGGTPIPKKTLPVAFHKNLSNTYKGGLKKKASAS